MLRQINLNRIERCITSRRKNIDLRWLSYSFYGVVLILLFCFFLMPNIIYALFPDVIKLKGISKILIGFIPHTVLIVVFLLFTSYKFDKDTPIYLKFGMVNWRFLYFPVALCGTFLLFPVGAIVTFLSMFIFRLFSISVPAPPLLTLLLSLDYYQLAIIVIFIVFIGPIIEELIFRLIIFEFLSVKIGMVPALLLTSFFFAGIHLNPIQFAALFILAFVMQCLYIYYNSIFASIIFHIVYNAFNISLLIIAKLVLGLGF